MLTGTVSLDVCCLFWEVQGGTQSNAKCSKYRSHICSRIPYSKPSREFFTNSISIYIYIHNIYMCVCVCAGIETFSLILLHMVLCLNAVKKTVILCLSFCSIQREKFHPKHSWTVLMRTHECNYLSYVIRLLERIVQKEKIKSFLECDIWGFHCGENLGCGVLLSDHCQFGWLFPAFQGTMPDPFAGCIII